GEFSANTFRATAVADFGQSGQVLRTEMFFEAVPDDFLDEEPAGWNWHPKDPDVPIVIPSDYLALYNFGFAPGQQLPQISQDIAKLSVFDILISGNGKEKIFKGRIAGFSDRINTILTPQKFLDYCNAEFGEKKSPEPNRIIVKASQSAPLEKFMQEQGYETNSETMRAGKAQDMARTVFMAAILIALVVVLISLGSFIQFADLMIARADNEIKTLSYLGYANSSITAILFKQIIAFVAISSAVALVVGVVLRYWLLSKIPALFPDPGFAPPLQAVGIFVLLIAVYFSITFINIRRQVASLTKGY
ncbi:MAG: FtsX-like permease family protein, partial [Flavobacteriales bacterium]